MDKKNDLFLKEIKEVKENKELYISFISFLLEEFQKDKKEVTYEESSSIL